jgi:hypothetical protein
MDLFGLTDLPAAYQTEECPKCHSAFQVSTGLCLRCLLQAGLGEDNSKCCGTRYCARSYHLDVALWHAKRQNLPVNSCELIADKLSKLGWSLGWIRAVDSEGRTVWTVDADRDNGKRFVIRSDELLTAFREVERITHELALSALFGDDSD